MRLKFLKFENEYKVRNGLQIIVMGTLYLLAFFLLENRLSAIHIIHCAVDNFIPFCEYFIVPYLMWFFYVFFTVAYFAFVNKNNEEYKPLIWTLLAGMVVFLIISYVYPNGQLLRPELTGDTIFKRLVLNLYATDTSTNILPSLHVFHSVACMIAIEKHDKVHKHPIVLNFIRILTVSIILSTMFLKQHSFIDVVTALAMNGVCCCLFYNIGEYKEWHEARVAARRKKKKFEGILR